MFSSILAANTSIITSVGRDVTNNNVMPSQPIKVPVVAQGEGDGKGKMRDNGEQVTGKVAADENANVVVPHLGRMAQTEGEGVTPTGYHSVPKMDQGSDETCVVVEVAEDLGPEESQVETCRSLNDLLSQVAELDEIYSDTQSNAFASTLSRATQIHMDRDIVGNGGTALPSDGSPQSDEITPMDYVDDLYETQTYSSLQMAMKNPVDIDFGGVGLNVLASSPPPPPAPLPPVQQEVSPGKREMHPGDGKLPPLPPKRIRKARPEDASLEDLTEERAPELPPKAPTHPLPPPPKAISSPKGSKPSLFQKLFSRKSSHPSSPPAPKVKKDEKRPSLPNTNTVVEPFNLNSGSHSSLNQPPQFKDDSEFIGSSEDLTEAEHYALYTDMAPRATVSEFDETSCYYSPVEGRPEMPVPMEVSVKRI
ncbi:embryonic polarity protein dorsal-like [Hetaerina americana]|uniref:embryonic polarity protein dorsal-like n=1 Tax=Hetaerina americana TaxID=62018 RepID=UPI003A7F3A6F